MTSQFPRTIARLAASIFTRTLLIAPWMLFSLVANAEAPYCPAQCLLAIQTAYINPVTNPDSRCNTSPTIDQDPLPGGGQRVTAFTQVTKVPAEVGDTRVLIEYVLNSPDGVRICRVLDDSGQHVYPIETTADAWDCIRSATARCSELGF